jgi:hypothetical protein
MQDLTQLIYKLWNSSTNMTGKRLRWRLTILSQPVSSLPRRVTTSDITRSQFQTAKSAARLLQTQSSRQIWNISWSSLSSFSPKWQILMLKFAINLPTTPSTCLSLCQPSPTRQIWPQLMDGINSAWISFVEWSGSGLQKATKLQLFTPNYSN